jgi:hypothetical protein
MKTVSTATLLAGLTTIGITSARKCQDLLIPIQVQARVAVFNASVPLTDIDATNFVLNMVQAGHNLTTQFLEGVCATIPYSPTKPNISLLG